MFFFFLTDKNSNQTAQYIQQNLGTQIPVLQPFQGRNPCMERNLLISGNSTEDIQSQNTLIDKSFKHLSTYYNSETQGLIGHDYLNQNGGPPPSLVGSPPIISNGLNHHQNGTIVNLTANRPATPIPYVQNVVYDNIPKPMPKTQNISGSSSALNEQNPTKYGKNSYIITFIFLQFIQKKLQRQCLFSSCQGICKLYLDTRHYTVVL